MAACVEARTGFHCHATAQRHGAGSVTRGRGKVRGQIQYGYFYGALPSEGQPAGPDGPVANRL